MAKKGYDQKKSLKNFAVFKKNKKIWYNNIHKNKAIWIEPEWIDLVFKIETLTRHWFAKFNSNLELNYKISFFINFQTKTCINVYIL